MEDARELRIIGYADLFAAMKPLLVPGGADRLERMDSDRAGAPACCAPCYGNHYSFRGPDFYGAL